MALHRGPKIITDGLILCLDAADRKSYVSGSNNWNDRSGKLANASLSGSPDFNSSNGGSIVFDGDNDYANIANNTIFKFTNTDPFSICFWTYWTGTTAVDYLFNFGNNDYGSGYYIGLDNDVLRTNAFFFDYYNAENDNKFRGLQGLNNAIEKNKWVNLVFTSLNNSATNMRFYRNGALGSYDIRGDISPASISYTSASLRIGVRANVDYYNGRIANVLIYNRQLSDSEVAFNFQSQRNRFGV
jgi:hypothetical protein